MVHDYYKNSCPDEGGVMAASLGRGLQMYEWSSCSASELRAYRIGGGTKCLMETDPANGLVKPSFPGRQYDLTYQCKAMFGDHAIVCPWANSVSTSRFLQSVYASMTPASVGFDSWLMYYVYMEAMESPFSGVPVLCFVCLD